MSDEIQRERVNWPSTKVDDVLARHEGYLVSSTRITVVKRTPKYAHLSDGRMIHVESANTNYYVWSDAYEREIERRRDKRKSQERVARLRLSMSIQAGGGFLTPEDALRDPAAILDLEELFKIFDAQRARIIERVIAERPKE